MLKTTLRATLGALALASAAALAAPVSNDGFKYIGGEGGWEPVQHSYVMNNGRFVHSDECDHAVRAPVARAAPAFNGGFKYIEGEGSWEPAQHSYVLSNGRYAHSNECDHAIRAAQIPTAAEIEAVRMLYAG